VAHTCNPSYSGVQNQPGQIVLETLSQKYPTQKKACGVSGSSGGEPAQQVLKIIK
jgi:hypothetical protein